MCKRTTPVVQRLKEEGNKSTQHLPCITNENSGPGSPLHRNQMRRGKGWMPPVCSQAGWGPADSWLQGPPTLGPTEHHPLQHSEGDLKDFTTDLLLPLLLTLQQCLKLKKFIQDLLQGKGKFSRPKLQRWTGHTVFTSNFHLPLQGKRKEDFCAGQGLFQAAHFHNSSLLPFCLSCLFPY